MSGFGRRTDTVMYMHVHVQSCFDEGQEAKALIVRRVVLAYSNLMNLLTSESAR